jgi:hypothetical protein
VPNVLKPGRLDLLETSGPVQACNGIALPFIFYTSFSPCQHLFTKGYLSPTAIWSEIFRLKEYRDKALKSKKSLIFGNIPGMAAWTILFSELSRLIQTIFKNSVILSHKRHRMSYIQSNGLCCLQKYPYCLKIYRLGRNRENLNGELGKAVCNI